jgi:hypothetical protein
VGRDTEDAEHVGPGKEAGQVGGQGEEAPRTAGCRLRKMAGDQGRLAERHKEGAAEVLSHTRRQEPGLEEPRRLAVLTDPVLGRRMVADTVPAGAGPTADRRIVPAAGVACRPGDHPTGAGHRTGSQSGDCGMTPPPRHGAELMLAAPRLVADIV